MRKIFLLVLLVLSSFSLKAQTFEMMNASEAYDLLLASPNYDESHKIVMFQAMYTSQMPGSELDLQNLKCNLWAALCIPTDTNDVNVYTYAILNIAGLPMIQVDQDVMDSAVKKLKIIDSKYFNNSGLAAAIAKNTEYLKYRKDNAGLFLIEQMSITSIPNTDSLYWNVGSAIDQNDAYFCRYDADKYVKLECMITTQTKVDKIVGLALNANPNPATDYVKISAPEQGEAKIEFINTLGENVKSLDSNFSGNETISTSDLNSGIYFVKLTINSKVYMQKVSVK